MSTRNDRFNASMRSLDEITASFEDPSKADVFSDKGQGVERMLDEIDQTPLTQDGVRNGQAALSSAKLHTAEMRLYRAGVGYLGKVLRLIVKNGTNRKKSIWELARR